MSSGPIGAAFAVDFRPEFPTAIIAGTRPVRHGSIRAVASVLPQIISESAICSEPEGADHQQ
jgi:hypothetical protein